MTDQLRVGRTAGLNFRYACVCGEARRIVAAGVNPALPLNPAWRTAGPCRACGHETRYWIETTPGAYVLHIERR